MKKSELRKLIREEIKLDESIPKLGKEIKYKQFWPKLTDSKNKVLWVKGWSKNNNIEFSSDKIIASTLKSNELVFSMKGDIALDGNKVSKIVREQDGYHFTMRDGTTIVIRIIEQE